MMINAVDIFCGCGGLSYGFAQEGFNLVGAFDNWSSAIAVYNENFRHKAESKNAYDITASDIKRFNPDLIIGGPPCQDYSSAGKRDETCGRADLTIRYAQIISDVRPKWFVMENVERITKSETLPKAELIYRKAGYGLTKVVLDASLCGVPQKRKRFFMIGEFEGRDDFLKDRLMFNLSKRSLSVYDYLGFEFGTEYYYRHPRSYKRRGIFSIYEPSPTVRGVNRPIPPNYQCHEGDATTDISKVRPLTSLERARIQTFPKSFRFIGSKTDIEQMVGNAVPVNLASYVARQLRDYISSIVQFDSVDIENQIRLYTISQPLLFE